MAVMLLLNGCHAARNSNSIIINKIRVIIMIIIMVIIVNNKIRIEDLFFNVQIAF